MTATTALCPPAKPLPQTLHTGSSAVVTRCQACDASALESILFLGYLPPVNQMQPIGRRPVEQPSYPAELLYCPRCALVQLGLVVDPAILFPPEYPYTSGTTKILRENFADLYRECRELFDGVAGRSAAPALVVDIGSNDGTLLGNFQAGGMRVLGIEPTDVRAKAIERGIPTIGEFFRREVGAAVAAEHGPAQVVTAANVFAHIENVHDAIEGVLAMLAPDGVFITESHHQPTLFETLQYDTIYHEHLRYYSLHSLRYLLNMHGLEVIHARLIPTHGGSIRVYAARRGAHAPRASVRSLLERERADGDPQARGRRFREGVVESKLALYELLHCVRRGGDRIVGIGAPSRASTLIHYVGLDDGILDCVLEVSGSLKIGKYMPGTRIPVVAEDRLFPAASGSERSTSRSGPPLEDSPTCALLLSWHIADELAANLRRKGYAGRFIVPLPKPRIVE